MESQGLILGSMLGELQTNSQVSGAAVGPAREWSVPPVVLYTPPPRLQNASPCVSADPLLLAKGSVAYCSAS